MLYRETPQGLVENVYTLKIINMAEHTRRFRVEVSGADSGLNDLQLVMTEPLVEVPPGEVISLPVSVQIDPVQLKRASSEVVFTLSAADDPGLTSSRKARFLGPVLSR